MKILNQTYREVESSESAILKTPVSELEQTSELIPRSLIHIVQFEKEVDGKSEYQSMKMEVSTFSNKVYEAVQNTLKESYFQTHCVEDSETGNISHPEGSPTGTSFIDMMNALNEYGNGWKTTEPDWNSSEWKIDGFVKHINFDFEVLRKYVVLKDNNLQKQLDEISGKFHEMDAFFASKMSLATTDSSGDITDISVNHSKTENDHYCQMHIEVGNKISNRWTVPATGNLVIYGWLDSSSALNNKAIPSSYCVIEGRINSPDDSDNWEIIAVQSVVPAKSITYVGFNLPVRKGLVIRARTGFDVGAKSSQYPNEQDGNDTLSNDVANGFKCMVFSNNITSKESEG